MKTYAISEDLLNKISSYLGMRPFSEVYQIIQALSSEIKNQQEVK